MAASIAFAVFAAVVSLYLTSQQSFAIGSAFLELHGGVRLAMDLLSNDIRCGTQIISTRTIDGQTYTTGDNELIIEVPALDNNGDIIDNVFDYVVYSLNSVNPQKLERIVDANAASSRADQTRLVAKNVNSLLFSSAGTGLSSVGDVTTLTNISASLTTDKTIFGNRLAQESLNSTVHLRNKR